MRPAWRSRRGLGVTALHPVGPLRRPGAPLAVGFAVAWAPRRAPLFPPDAHGLPWPGTPRVATRGALSLSLGRAMPLGLAAPVERRAGDSARV